MPEKNQLTLFLTKWCAIQTAPEGGDPPVYYCRIRAGRTRKAADVVWRRNTASEDPGRLAAEVLDRFSMLDKGAKAWLEVLQKGGTNGVVDVCPMGEAHGDGEASEEHSPLGDLDMTTGIGVIGVVVSAIVETNGQLASRLSSGEQRYHDLLTKYIEVAGRATASETMLEWIDKHGTDNDGMSAAIETLAPHLAPVLSRLVSRWDSKPQPKPEPGAPETPEVRADRMIAEGLRLCDESPDVLRERQIKLMELGVKLQNIIMPTEKT